MRSQRKQYSSEFKQEAVRLVTEGGVSVAQAARDLGIGDNLLHRWKKELHRHGSKAFPGHGVPVEQELARLQRENQILRQERDVLKKAVGIFSQQQP